VNDPEPKVKSVTTTLIHRLVLRNDPLALDLYVASLHSLLTETDPGVINAKESALYKVTQNVNYVLPHSELVNFIPLVSKYFVSFNWSAQIWFVVDWCIRRVLSPFSDVNHYGMEEEHETIPATEYNSTLQRIHTYVEGDFLTSGHYELEGWDLTASGFSSKARAVFDLHQDGSLYGTILMEVWTTLLFVE
jgi:hypothetical protein